MGKLNSWFLFGGNTLFPCFSSLVCSCSVLLWSCLSLPSWIPVCTCMSSSPPRLVFKLQPLSLLLGVCLVLLPASNFCSVPHLEWFSTSVYLPIISVIKTLLDLHLCELCVWVKWFKHDANIYIHFHVLWHQPSLKATVPLTSNKLENCHMDMSS